MSLKVQLAEGWGQGSSLSNLEVAAMCLCKLPREDRLVVHLLVGSTGTNAWCPCAIGSERMLTCLKLSFEVEMGLGW